MIANANDHTNTVRYPPSPMGNTARIAKAISGPISAPAVSMARCTPKLRPRWAGSDAVAIKASLGPVRRPLPSRSTATTEVIAQNPLTNSSPSGSGRTGRSR